MPKSWFEADKEGLAQLVADRGKAFVIFELVQNAWDEAGVTEVTVELTKVPGRPYADLVVKDDAPEGFSDLTHAFTLFGKSDKKANPEQRGRFNLGEKLVLAICEEASITTTKGTVRFDGDGRDLMRLKTKTGSVFNGRIRMTQPEFEEVCREVPSLLPPKGIITLFNEERLPYRKPVFAGRCTLDTMRADDEGVLRRTRRETQVEVYEPLGGEKASIYEMGIPVVETGDKWHINVCQKVPLNMNRDNVTPAYLRKLRAEVLSYMHVELTEEEAATPWVHDALGSKVLPARAVESIFRKRFGDKAVIYDPSDPEANARSAAQGRPIVRGGSLSKEAWANVREHKAALPAGQVTPTPKPFSPEGKPLKLIPPEEWTPQMVKVIAFARWLGGELLGFEPMVDVTGDASWNFSAAYGDGHLTLSKRKLGAAWFERPSVAKVVDLLVHEYAHQFESNHLSEGYYRAISRLAGLAVKTALESPERFKL